MVELPFNDRRVVGSAVKSMSLPIGVSVPINVHTINTEDRTKSITGGRTGQADEGRTSSRTSSGNESHQISKNVDTTCCASSGAMGAVNGGIVKSNKESTGTEGCGAH